MSSTLKRMPAGLYSHGAPPPPAYRSAYSGGWVNVPWSAIEPTKGYHDRAPIDAAVKRFTDQGYRDVRLRVFAGGSCPEWVYDEFGSVDVKDYFQSVYTRVVPFWASPGFMLRYDLLMRWLNVEVCAPSDVIIEVAMSACMTVFAEVMNRNLGDTTSVRNMIDAGYTFEKDHSAMAEMARIHARRFGRTRSGIACNPWGNPETGKVDVAATMNFQDYCRSILGAKCILENNSLDAVTHEPATYNQMYSHMQTLGKPLAFQTKANDRLTDPAGMIDFACKLGASAVETEVRPPFTPDDAALYAEQLKAKVRG